MKRCSLVLLTVGLALVLVTPALAQGDAEVQRKLLAEKVSSIVTVKFVMKLHVQIGVQERDQEVEREISGLLVSPDGLVIIPNNEISPRTNNPRVSVTGTAVDFKVLFPGDDEETEHEAVLAAKDSNLQLAFVAMKDPTAAKLSPVDFGSAAKTEIGQKLYGVARLSREFDFAPVIGTFNVLAKVAKPRRMHLIAGTFTLPGMVLYDGAGMPAGVLAVQQGAAQRETRVFLLPPDVVKASIKQAAESAKEVLAESGEKDGEDEGDDKETDDGGR